MRRSDPLARYESLSQKCSDLRAPRELPFNLDRYNKRSGHVEAYSGIMAKPFVICHGEETEKRDRIALIALSSVSVYVCVRAAIESFAFPLLSLPPSPLLSLSLPLATAFLSFRCFIHQQWDERRRDALFAVRYLPLSQPADIVGRHRPPHPGGSILIMIECAGDAQCNYARKTLCL